MRLMKRYLRELPRRRKSGQKSDYAGHETTLAEAPPIKAQVNYCNIHAFLVLSVFNLIIVAFGYVKFSSKLLLG